MNRNDAEAGNANVKDHRLAEPKEARFVKFSMELPTGENAVRIYGFDIYGKLKERTDRGNLVSVGKTFLIPLPIFSTGVQQLFIWFTSGCMIEV